MDSQSLAGFAALLNGFRTGRAEKLQQESEAKKASSAEALQQAQIGYYGRQNPMVSSKPYSAAFSNVSEGKYNPEFPNLIPLEEAQALNPLLDSWKARADAKAKQVGEKKESERVANALGKQLKEVRSAIYGFLEKGRQLPAAFGNDTSSPEYKTAAQAVADQLTESRKIEADIIRRGQLLGYAEFAPLEDMPTNPFPSPAPTPPPASGVNPAILQGLQNRVRSTGWFK